MSYETLLPVFASIRATLSSFARRAALLLLCAAACAATSRAADDTVTLNFVNADIDAVVKAIAEITGRNFIVDPKVKGTVNIVSSRPVPKELVYPTLLSALRMQGIVAVEGDNVVKLVPEVDARTLGTPVLSARGNAAGGDDRLVTQVITLRYESAVQLVNVLRPMIAPNNTIAAYPASNALVITDYADNMRRIARVIASLDQPPVGEPVLVTLKNASAIDLVGTVSRLLNDTGTGQPVDATQRVTLVADPRSNGVLIRSDNPARAARARQLIGELDTPGRAGGNMFIVYLKNAEAVKVAQTLRAMLTGQESTATSTSGSGLAPNYGSNSGSNGMQSPATPATPGTNAAQALPFTPASSASSAFTAGGATISADASSNALVIMAPEPVYNNLRTIIDKLDVRRAQVFIEALIAEVSADKAAEFGIQWQALSGTNSTQTRVIGGTNFNDRGSGGNILDIAANLGSAGQGLNLGVIRGTISIPGFGTISNLSLLARALETQVNANILSTPTILTLDNEEARIVVGENVPFITGQYANTGSTSTVTPFQTIERRDVGLLLRVKPQIAEGGSVRINLYQEVSRVESQSASGPILQKRSLDSTVVVDDGGIAVLGGLMQDQFNDGSDKVPIAGDIPIVGQLFRYDARHRVKTNLMIFLRPVVLRNAADGRGLASERYDYLRGQQEMQGMPPRFFWTDPAPQPALPLPMGTMPDTPAGATPPPQSPEPVGK
ncbi:MAG: type II secretion system secretin GspD [Betaproteobacteria bacterium]